MRNILNKIPGVASVIPAALIAAVSTQPTEASTAGFTLDEAELSERSNLIFDPNAGDGLLLTSGTLISEDSAAKPITADLNIFKMLGGEGDFDFQAISEKAEHEQEVRQQILAANVNVQEQTDEKGDKTIISFNLGDVKTDGTAISIKYMPNSDVGILSEEGQDPQIIVTTAYDLDKTVITATKEDDYQRLGEVLNLLNYDMSENARAVWSPTKNDGYTTVGFPIQAGEGANIVLGDVTLDVSDDVAAVKDFIDFDADEVTALHAYFMQQTTGVTEADSAFGRQIEHVLEPTNYKSGFNAATQWLADDKPLPKPHKDMWLTASYDRNAAPVEMTEHFSKTCKVDKFGANTIFIPGHLEHAYGHIPSDPDVFFALDKDTRERFGVVGPGSFYFNFETGRYGISKSVAGTRFQEFVDGCLGELTGAPNPEKPPVTHRTPPATGTPFAGPSPNLWKKPGGGGYYGGGGSTIVTHFDDPDKPIIPFDPEDTDKPNVVPAPLGLLLLPTGLAALGGLWAMKKSKPETVGGNLRNSTSQPALLTDFEIANDYKSGKEWLPEATQKGAKLATSPHQPQYIELNAA